MSKLLQKIVISLLAILLATSFVGCGAKKSDSDTSATLAERMYAEGLRISAGTCSRCLSRPARSTAAPWRRQHAT